MESFVHFSAADESLDSVDCKLCDEIVKISQIRCLKAEIELPKSGSVTICCWVSVHFLKIQIQTPAAI